MAFRAPFRSLATNARKSLKIGMIPADGIGHEVLPVCASLPSSAPLTHARAQKRHSKP